MPTVDIDAADGNAGNDNGNGDHYLEHNDPVFDAATMHQGDSWGDIIPPIPGIHNGLNWTAAGQAIYFNGCAPVTQATPAVVTFNDVCGTASDTYTIPSKTGVDYKVSGNVKTAGTYAGNGTVTVTAVAQAGYVLTGTTSWAHTFTNVACPCLTKVTPGVVTFNEACGTQHDTYTIPAKTGVVYKVNGQVVDAGSHNGAGTVTVEAFAEQGYELTGKTSWEYTFTNVPCPVEVTPGEVTFTEVCGTAHDTFTIPSTTGVVYKVNGDVVTAGTHPGSGTVTVTSTPESGYVLTGTTSWAHTFTNEDCPVPPVDVCKNIDGPQATVPFGMTVDNAGNCTTPGIPQVLGDSTVAPTSTPAVNAADLVNTGSSIVLNLFAGMFVIGLATIITIASRKNSNLDASRGTTTSA
jgi:hypothetical protein